MSAVLAGLVTILVMLNYPQLASVAILVRLCSAEWDSPKADTNLAAAEIIARTTRGALTQDNEYDIWRRSIKTAIDSGTLLQARTQWLRGIPVRVRVNVPYVPTTRAAIMRIRAHDETELWATTVYPAVQPGTPSRIWHRTLERTTCVIPTEYVQDSGIQLFVEIEITDSIRPANATGDGDDGTAKNPTFRSRVSIVPSLVDRIESILIADASLGTTKLLQECLFFERGPNVVWPPGATLCIANYDHSQMPPGLVIGVTALLVEDGLPIGQSQFYLNGSRSRYEIAFNDCANSTEVSELASAIGARNTGRHIVLCPNIAMSLASFEDDRYWSGRIVLPVERPH